MAFNTHDLQHIVGKNIFYTYELGWQYEMYVKNDATIDYRAHKGIVAGRWVKDQPVCIIQLAPNIFRVSWSEEATGNNVAISLNLNDAIAHSTIFFPRWIMNNPALIACHQNTTMEATHAHREAGPIHPIEHIDSMAKIDYIRECGSNNEAVINCSASDLPANYPFCLPDTNLLDVAVSSI